MQSQCGSCQIVGAKQERKMDEKKSTQRSSFFTKRTAMLFFVVACIFLKHQDDTPRQGVNAPLQVDNIVCRNLGSTETEEEAPSKNNSGFGGNKKVYLGKGAPKLNEKKLQGKEDYVGNARMDDKTYLNTLQESYDHMDNDDKKEQKRKEEKKKEKKKCQKKFSTWEKRKDKMEECKEKKYKDKISKNRKKCLRHDEQKHIDEAGELDKLLFGELELLEKYGTHKVSTFHYEMIPMDKLLTDDEINKELNEMEEMPKKCELVALYWKSYVNEIRNYVDTIRYLFEKFLELKKKQNFETLGKCNNKWKKCSKIVSTNFKDQRDYVNHIFYAHMTKENLSRDEFKEILGHLRDSWKELTLKVTQECVALLEEPIVPDVKILDYKPYSGKAFFKVTRMSSPQVSS
ncbi:Plasmodium exported protein, unknown function [Plasmodium knowlesi strain H]|uniref:Plasmodium RESA N-terminal domain-containing protein n=3 Tax=Plasmodium knowlesi TaxID=5850 RepID=A0A5K1U3D9_PLAKH|nr:Plasmodium exported protein (PHIST), unknown function [Plasmodium knowlesi strain H]OTN67121.1 Uncharacterized protein PKNOH_S07470700 [Plasmodium knowlesi]CAA9988831.1 Plasmodium exported protein (PHIST), unknown function [Plasmodium knowlesi strain H]SBO21853.1 Plasmodium exported protein, unknown function [Plasmodium knowlesi strain H]SBO22217.1 Plasmodium exported protein, unknown function [Plasmodium knowlesi strain H]VVS78305.1 Plasmodium exported protein (PHIST), unknown function [Pl|eukprot:XP_002259810.1 hypothetical protein, conserved in Plasmodium species [Plasmodium knowlesi strain H]